MLKLAILRLFIFMEKRYLQLDMKQILIATRNLDKVREIGAKFKGLSWEVKSLLDFPQIPEVVEDRVTLEENAMKKAAAGFNAAGLLTLADDTGLEVEALNGRPGVYSSRYAGENASYSDNRRKLLQELKGIPWEKRKAVFRTVAVLMDEKGVITFIGRCSGIIISEERGAGGFGYDPVFFIAEYGMTFAEMPLELKNRISHRGLAVEKVVDYLQKKLQL